MSQDLKAHGTMVLDLLTNKKDFSEARKHLDANVESHRTGREPFTGIDTLLSSYKQFVTETAPNAMFHTKETFVDGDKVRMVGKVTGLPGGEEKDAEYTMTFNKEMKMTKLEAKEM